MVKFILRRVVRGLVALLLFQSLLFLLIQALPYDTSAFVLASPSWRAFIRNQLGLNRPLLDQYLSWLWNFLHLDLGLSYQFWPTPVSEILVSRLFRTLLLFMTAAIPAYVLGIWLGKMIAWRRGGWFEVGATLGGIAAYTSFAPWLGFLMINVFGWYLGWFPYQRLVNHNVWFDAPVSVEWVLGRLLLTAVLSMSAWMVLWRVTRRFKVQGQRWTVRLIGLLIISVGVWGGWSLSGRSHLAWDVLSHLALPMSTIILLSFGETMMVMRAAMLDTLPEDYVLMAQAKGLPQSVVRDRYVARNALLPVLTRLMLSLPFVLVGSLVIERVFMWQAMGEVIFMAIEYQDIPVLLGILSIVGVIVLVAHVVLDILYFFLDPRMRYVGES